MKEWINNFLFNWKCCYCGKSKHPNDFVHYGQCTQCRDEKRQKEVDEYGFYIGQQFITKDVNPFKRYILEIVDLQEGYVKYRYAGETRNKKCEELLKSIKEYYDICDN